MDMLAELGDHADILVLLGGLLLVAGVLGGGIEIKELRLRPLPVATRVLSSLCGVGLLAVGVLTPASPSVGVAPASAPGFAPAPAPERRYGSSGYPEIQLYEGPVQWLRVCNVAPDDPDGLNIREHPGVSRNTETKTIRHRKIHHIPHDATRVRFTRLMARVRGTTWYSVEHGGVSGWASSAYLCPASGDCRCLALAPGTPPR